jgi:glycerophosphoryl diester phosphodiesterase
MTFNFLDPGSLSLTGSFCFQATMRPSLRQISEKILIFGHRGASGYAPENTLSSFEEAVRRESDIIELDIQLTSEESWIVMHDLTLKRTCGISKRVSRTPLSLVRTLDAGSWFSRRFAGEKIPTLDELLAWASRKICLNIEIKGPVSLHSKALDHLLDKIARHHLADGVLLSSFHWDLLGRIRRLNRSMPIGLLVSREKEKDYLSQAIELKAFSIHLPFRRLTRASAKKIHDQGMKIFLYTVNRAALIDRYIDLGADGFFSNYPDLLVKKRSDLIS